jgi:hypothetical protein
MRKRGAATHSILITCGLPNSVEFNKSRNLVRDQGVGGSNPLSPTYLFKYITSISDQDHSPSVIVTRVEGTAPFSRLQIGKPKLMLAGGITQLSCAASTADRSGM